MPTSYHKLIVPAFDQELEAVQRVCNSWQRYFLRYEYLWHWLFLQLAGKPDFSQNRIKI